MDVTQLWAAETALDHYDGGLQYMPLRHTAGNRFRNAGVGAGDRVFILHVGTVEGFEDGRVHLVGRLIVDQPGVLSGDAAATRMGVEADDLWDARDHLVARAATEVAMDFERVLPADVLRRLRFVSESGTTATLDVDDDGRLLRRQQLRGVRRLEPGSAEVLETFLSEVDRDLPERHLQWALDELQDLLDVIEAATRVMEDDAPGVRSVVAEVAARARELAGHAPSPVDEAVDADLLPLVHEAAHLIEDAAERLVLAAADAPDDVTSAFTQAVRRLVDRLEQAIDRQPAAGSF